MKTHYLEYPNAEEEEHLMAIPPTDKEIARDQERAQDDNLETDMLLVFREIGFVVFEVDEDGVFIGGFDDDAPVH